MNTTRREFEERQYIEAAFFLQVPAKKLRMLHIAPVTPLEFDAINAIAHKLNERHYIKYYQDKFYYRGNPSANELLCSAYLINVKQTFQLVSMLNKLHLWEKRNLAINETYKSYHENLQYALSKYSEISTYQLQNFSIRTINKIMAKHKGYAEFTEDSLKLTFNKIKCGNEIEGYINYKAITVFLPLSKMGTRNLNSNRIIYTFQKFSIDTYDKIVGVPTLHPHISSWGSSEFCFGNRDGDWDIYAETYNFPFMIDLIYESLHTFNPASPYIHVNTLINIIKTLNVVYKDYRKMNPQSNPSELASHIFRGVNKCNRCGTILSPEGVCFVEGCHANPNATVSCNRCGIDMERGEWNNGHSAYNWICRNTSCSNSPDYVRPPMPPMPLCRICGQELRIESTQATLTNSSFGGGVVTRGSYTTFVCGNREHSRNGIWQFVRNNDTNALTDLREHHYPEEFEREIERWIQNHPMTVAGEETVTQTSERTDGGTVEEETINDL